MTVKEKIELIFGYVEHKYGVGDAFLEPNFCKKVVNDIVVWTLKLSELDSTQDRESIRDLVVKDIE